MVGPTAQLVALACHFNARARGASSAAFFPVNSTCQFCEYARFVQRRVRWFGRAGDWELVAETPDQWLSTQAKSSRRALITREPGRDSRLSDRMAAGFVGGGGTWELWIVESGRADAWNPAWQVGNRTAPDRRIWRVTYARTATRVAREILAEPLEPLRARFENALSKALVFCGRHNVEGFASQFRNAVESLSSANPFSLVYHKDLAPAGTLSLAAQQLLAGSSAAWVFGGMGSWNDLYFDSADKDDYERISDELFEVVNRSIVAATNSAAFPR